MRCKLPALLVSVYNGFSDFSFMRALLFISRLFPYGKNSNSSVPWELEYVKLPVLDTFMMRLPSTRYGVVAYACAGGFGNETVNSGLLE